MTLDKAGWECRRLPDSRLERQAIKEHPYTVGAAKIWYLRSSGVNISYLILLVTAANHELPIPHTTGTDVYARMLNPDWQPKQKRRRKGRRSVADIWFPTDEWAILENPDPQALGLERPIRHRRAAKARPKHRGRPHPRDAAAPVVDLEVPEAPVVHARSRSSDESSSHSDASSSPAPSSRSSSHSAASGREPGRGGAGGDSDSAGSDIEIDDDNDSGGDEHELVRIQGPGAGTRLHNRNPFASTPFGCGKGRITPRNNESGEVTGYQITCGHPGHKEAAVCQKTLSISVAGDRDVCLRMLKAWIIAGANKKCKTDHTVCWADILQQKTDGLLPSMEELEEQGRIYFAGSLADTAGPLAGGSSSSGAQGAASAAGSAEPPPLPPPAARPPQMSQSEIPPMVTIEIHDDAAALLGAAGAVVDPVAACADVVAGAGGAADALGGIHHPGISAELHAQMLELHSRGVIPTTTPEQRCRQKLTKGERYKVPEEIRPALFAGYVSPNLPPPDGWVWRRRGGGWHLAQRGG